MTAEKEEFLANWRAVYGEIFPYRRPETMQVDDATLALGILLCRQIEMAVKTKVIHPAYAEGAVPQRNVRSKGDVEVEG